MYLQWFKQFYPDLRQIIPHKPKDEDEAKNIYNAYYTLTYQKGLSTQRQAVEYNPFCIILGLPKIGKATWIGPFTVIDGSAGLSIGSGCSIAAGVHIYTHDSVRWATQGLEKDGKHLDRAPVSIGNHVFIGANSVICRGVTIGDGAVIGAGCVIKEDVAAYEKVTR